MRKSIALIKCWLLVLALIAIGALAGYGQIHHNSETPQDEDYIKEVIGSLDEFNILRLALEQGDRGDGQHHPWMDIMKKLGIAQVTFTFKFEWRKNRVTNLKQRNIKFHPVYYQYDVYFKDKQKLKEITNTSLKKVVLEEASNGARRFIGRILNRECLDVSTEGLVYFVLLDDERLPAVVEMPEFECRQSGGV
ncbi:MAG: hypothetical protein R2684_12080 [Pyrinomonadaceae bacterium]